MFSLLRVAGPLWPRPDALLLCRWELLVGGQGDPATSRAWEFGGRARKGAHAFGGEGWFVVAEGENVRGGRWVVPDDGYVGRI